MTVVPLTVVVPLPASVPPAQVIGPLISRLPLPPSVPPSKRNCVEMVEA